MLLFLCKCGRGKKTDSKITAVRESTEETFNSEENPTECNAVMPVEKQLHSIAEVDGAEDEFVNEEVFGVDAEADAKLVKRLEELLVPYLKRESLRVIRISYNEYIYLDQKTLVNINKEQLISVVSDLVKKHAVNKWVSHFDGNVYIFKKRNKLINFKKNKVGEIKSSIIEYHLEKEAHDDGEKKLICIEEFIVGGGTSAK